MGYSNRMKLSTFQPGIALILGVIFVAAGVGLVGGYVVEAVIARIGEPDQSLLFWYLPILFIGIAAMMIGLFAFVWGARRLRPRDSEQ